MVITGNDILILFRLAKPEHLENCLMKSNDFLTYKEISESLYLKYAKECYSFNSENELLEHYHRLKEILVNDKNASFFKLLSKFSEDKLIVIDSLPIVDFNSILDWRQVSHQTGEDLLVTAFLAKKTLDNNLDQMFYDWPTNLRSNNRQLQKILNQGMSENHFHLNGSAQIFPISWISLMNNPSEIAWRIKKIENNLSPSLYFGHKDNRDDWATLLIEAAKIRLNLFCKIHSEFLNLKIDDQILSTNQIHKSISSITFSNSYRDPKSNCFLDYALCKNLHSHNYKNNRILVGERKFLFDCFKASFDNVFTQSDNNDFYKYLLIKSNFRAEMIQNNQISGFKNFANYQSRKKFFVSGIKKYEEEAIRTALTETLSTQAIVSLEARIMPCESIKNLNSVIHYYDSTFEKTLDVCENLSLNRSYPYSFVLHYPKGITDYCFSKNNSLIEQTQKLLPIVRNCKQRKKYKIYSEVTMQALNKNNNLKKRIIGIDACSNEIGCRPDVFATEYRFIKNFKFTPPDDLINRGESNTAFLGRTYHVGEDFLDIVDGLRAIDEVLLFLDFSHGDRLGHALALGVNPSEYYAFKNYRIVTTQQDALDNLVWIYNKSNEMNIAIEPILKQKIEFEIHKLANRIYGNINMTFPQIEINLDAFSLYCAWKLRGDHPQLYRSGDFKSTPLISSQYDKAMYKDSHELNELRKRKNITTLYHFYHFDYEAKKEGAIPYEFEISTEYIALVEQVQKKMQFEIASKGIMIECNPSSNCLIGTFRDYEKHPIISFNNLHLEIEPQELFKCPQLSVSINTDDKGVFNTSLEFEYSLMASALMKLKTQEGRPKYSLYQIYEYLDNVRKMGNIQSFIVQRKCNNLFDLSNSDYSFFDMKFTTNGLYQNKKID